MKKIILCASILVFTACSTFSNDVIKGNAPTKFNELLGVWDIVSFQADGVRKKRKSQTKLPPGYVTFQDGDIFAGVALGPQVWFILGCNPDSISTELVDGHLLERPIPKLPEGYDIVVAGIGCSKDGYRAQAAIKALMSSDPSINKTGENRLSINSEHGQILLEREEIGHAARAPLTLTDVSGIWKIHWVSMTKDGLGTSGWIVDNYVHNPQLTLSPKGLTVAVCPGSNFWFSTYKSGLTKSSVRPHALCRSSGYNIGNITPQSTQQAILDVLSGELRFELTPEIRHDLNPPADEVLRIYNGLSYLTLVR